MPTRMIDADGHVLEDVEAIKRFLPHEWRSNTTTRTQGVFPPLDHMHIHLDHNPPGAFEDPSPNGWVRFLDELGFEAAVLYPTSGLSFGRMIDVELAAGTTRAYNDWLNETYLERDSRLKGIGLIPMQEPEAAVDELRRVVRDLGFVGALLPANGLKSHYGDKIFWPVYDEANRLGCCLSVHGGAYGGLGFDHLNAFPAIHALGHPLSVAICFASIIVNGIPDRFQNVRWGFLEAGVGWLLMALERLEGSFGAFTPYNPKLQGTPTENIMRHIKAGRIFVGVEGEEPDLAHAVRRLGPDAFVFSSDFPHEVNIQTCKHEVEEVLENPELDDNAKRAIFAANAERFYGLKSPAGVA